ncbi:hypothetical protein NL676_033101 [Syzygium grande]|nr:hypothetical protein NL676_033101 [Syzygium grande]
MPDAKHGEEDSLECRMPDAKLECRMRDVKHGEEDSLECRMPDAKHEVEDSLECRMPDAKHEAEDSLECRIRCAAAAKHQQASLECPQAFLFEEKKRAKKEWSI